MKQVSLQELKIHLSRLVEEVAGGETLVVTRYGRPVVRIEAAGQAGLAVGQLFGRSPLTPLFRRATEGRYLELLQEDRRGGSEAD